VLTRAQEFHCERKDNESHTHDIQFVILGEYPATGFHLPDESLHLIPFFIDDFILFPWIFPVWMERDNGYQFQRPGQFPGFILSA